MTRGKAILIAVDQVFNAMLGSGWPDETLSAYAWRLSKQGRPRWQGFIDALFFWQNRHCYNSYLSEQRGLHLPEELRTNVVEFSKWRDRRGQARWRENKKAA
jgi:hypothetical protein